MTWYWWDDAIGSALELFAATGIKHKVQRTASGWTVDLADTAVLQEVCS